MAKTANKAAKKTTAKKKTISKPGPVPKKR